MKELELKYGCNPNQKPAKIFTNDGRDLLAACKRAESGNRYAGGGFL